MSTRKKRQHFVPQGYLKRFRNENSTEKVIKVWVADRFVDKTLSLPIDNVASRDGFYDSRIDKFIHNKGENAVENLLEEEESRFYNALEILDKAILERSQIPDQVKPVLSWYMYLQFIRTSKFRSGLKIPSGSEIEDYQKIAQIYGMAEEELSREFIKLCLSKIWIVYEASGRMTIPTSDNPVLFDFDEYRLSLQAAMKGRDVAFGDLEGMRIIFPLDARHVLFLYDPRTRQDLLNSNNKILPFDDQESVVLWYSIPNNCERQVYSASGEPIVSVLHKMLHLSETLKPVAIFFREAIDFIRKIRGSPTSTADELLKADEMEKVVDKAMNEFANQLGKLA